MINSVILLIAVSALPRTMPPFMATTTRITTNTGVFTPTKAKTTPRRTIRREGALAKMTKHLAERGELLVSKNLGTSTIE